MSDKPIKVLLIEDNPGDARLIKEILLEAGVANYKLEWVDRLAEGLERLASGGINIVLTDLGLPDTQGLDTLLKLRTKFSQVPVVVLTGLGYETLGIKAIQEGAQDYLVKGQVDANVLSRAIRYAIERQQLSKELLEAKNYTESIIKNFLDTLIVVDTKAKIQMVNPETCHLLGYTEEELLGQPIGMLFAEEEEEEEVRRVFQFFRQRETVETLRPQDNIRNRELTCKTKDGRLIPMSFNASVLSDEEGNITAVVAGAKDITELKLAEIEIRRGKVFSENIIATVPDSLLVLDRDLTIKSANRSFYELFQTEPEKIIGRKIADILGDKDGKLSAKLGGLFGTGDMLENFELRYRSEKLGERILNIGARGIVVAEEEEEEEEELVVIQDITERKHAEQMKSEARQMAEKVEQLERELHYLERFSTPQKTAATAGTFGLKPFRQASPDMFNQVVRQYGDLLELALEQQGYRVEHDISGKLRTIAEQLRFLKAGARDVVEIHSSALRSKTDAVSHTKAQGYAEEGRVMVLELMGQLVSCYRTYSLSAITMK